MKSIQNNNYHHGDLQNALIEAALKLIKKKNGWQFTLREVARIAGVSHTAPYRHFADKASLLTELAIFGFEKMANEISKTIDTKLSAKDQLIAAAKSYIEFGTKNSALTGINWYYKSGWFAGLGLRYMDAGRPRLNGNSGDLKVDSDGLSTELKVGFRF